VGLEKRHKAPETKQNTKIGYQQHHGTDPA
jgi:hypothetical protein